LEQKPKRLRDLAKLVVGQAELANGLGIVAINPESVPIL